MTSSAIVYTDAADSAAAGASLGTQIKDGLGGEIPDAVILFASPRYDFPPLLRALDQACRPRILVGSSSAGEFTSKAQGVGTACAIALRSPDLQFAAGVGHKVSGDRAAVAAELTAGFKAAKQTRFPHAAALVLTDALAGHADDLIEQLTLATGGRHRFFGGGAGGDDAFARRFVFHGTEALADAAVGLEILSMKPLGIGVRHGWSPTSPALRVTEAEGTTLGSLNATAAAEVFEEHAQTTHQRFDRAEPLPFFLHNVIGVNTGAGYKIRVPLAVNGDGSVATATEVPSGAVVNIMGVDTQAAAEAAAESTRDAVRQLGGGKPAVAIFFDCVATRLRMGSDFSFELAAVQDALGEASFAGCNSIGQIARSEGQLSGFHNCTAVVCVIPE
jgi:hypothetical protein